MEDGIIEALHKAFGAKCSDMFGIDGLMTAMVGRPVFGVDKLEKWCHADGMGDDTSMAEYLTARFGEERYNLILKALALQ